MTNNQKGIEFEKSCYKKLEEIGFSDLQLTNNTDNGADIIGTYNKTKYAFQCKNHAKAQGNKCVQEVIAAKMLYHCNRAAVISNSSFTPAAIKLAKANNCIILIASEFFLLQDFPPNQYGDTFENVVTYEMDYDVITNYEQHKKTLGRIPKGDELTPTLRYKIKKHYGNYTNFLEVIGDIKFSKKPTDEELQKEYQRVRAEIGKVPTLSDMKLYSSYSNNSFHAYPFTKLQEECGDRPHIKRGVSKKELQDEYLILEKQLKHPPTIKELDEYGKYKSSYYRNRWGNFNTFLSDIGRTRTQANLPRVYSKEDIAIIYSLIKILLSYTTESDDYAVNHTVLERLRFDEKAIISPSTISKKFGTWADFIKYFEENALDKRVEQVLVCLKQDGLQGIFDALET